MAFWRSTHSLPTARLPHPSPKLGGGAELRTLPELQGVTPGPAASPRPHVQSESRASESHRGLCAHPGWMETAALGPRCPGVSELDSHLEADVQIPGTSPQSQPGGWGTCSCKPQAATRP